MQKHLRAEPASIIVDWGTSSLRATLLSDCGHSFDRIECHSGIQFITDGDFEKHLHNAIDPWLEQYGPLPVVALGMITSKSGWVEVDYVACPATLGDLRRGTATRVLKNGSALTLLPGLNDPSRTPFADVMRGEETQIVGFGLTRDINLVLPGTHSKWARIRNAKIDGFQTFVTGELFALLSEHSFIAKVSEQRVTKPGWRAYDLGMKNAQASQTKSNPLQSILFSARTGMLSQAIGEEDLKEYISGLLIGHEFREAQSGGWFSKGDTIGIVGNDGLIERYSRAAESFGLSVMLGRNDAAEAGALMIAS